MHTYRNHIYGNNLFYGKVSQHIVFFGLPFFVKMSFEQV